MVLALLANSIATPQRQITICGQCPDSEVRIALPHLLMRTCVVNVADKIIAPVLMGGIIHHASGLLPLWPNTEHARLMRRSAKPSFA